jgi:hypothetical protein
MRLCGRGLSGWKPLCKESLLPKQAPNRARASVRRGGVRKPRPYLLSIQLTALPYKPSSVPLLRPGHIPPPHSTPYLLDTEGENRGILPYHLHCQRVPTYFLTGTASKQAYFALHLQKTWQKIPFSSHTAPCGKCSSAFLVRASA